MRKPENERIENSCRSEKDMQDTTKNSNMCLVSSLSRRRAETIFRISSKNANLMKIPSHRFKRCQQDRVMKKKTTPAYITIKKLENKTKSKSQKKNPKRRVLYFQRNNHRNEKMNAVERTQDKRIME